MATSIEFTEAQQDTASIISRIVWTVKGWEEADVKARQDVATARLSSFNIDALVTAASRATPLHYANAFLRKLDGVAVISESGRVLEMTDDDQAQDLLTHFQEVTVNSYMEWYRPNSTSNVDVEIKLGEHEAWLHMSRVASGKRF